MQVETPAFYIVSRGLSGEDTVEVLRCLAMTPVSCVIITDIYDAEFAQHLGTETIRCADESAAVALALKIAQTTGQSPLVVGGTKEGATLQAVYKGDRVEVVCVPQA